MCSGPLHEGGNTNPLGRGKKGLSEKKGLITVLLCQKKKKGGNRCWLRGEEKEKALLKEREKRGLAEGKPNEGGGTLKIIVLRCGKKGKGRPKKGPGPWGRKEREKIQRNPFPEKRGGENGGGLAIIGARKGNPSARQPEKLWEKKGEGLAHLRGEKREGGAIILYGGKGWSASSTEKKEKKGGGSSISGPKSVPYEEIPQRLKGRRKGGTGWGCRGRKEKGGNADTGSLGKKKRPLAWGGKNGSLKR